MRDTAARIRPRPRRRLRLMAALAGMVLATLITAGPATAAPTAPVAQPATAAQPAMPQPVVYADFDGDTIKAQETYVAPELLIVAAIIGGAAAVLVIGRFLNPRYVGIRPFGKYGPEL